MTLKRGFARPMLIAIARELVRVSELTAAEIFSDRDAKRQKKPKKTPPHCLPAPAVFLAYKQRLGRGA